MRSLSALGLRPEDVLEPLPALSLQAQLAIDCWNFCDGWDPSRWPLFAALHDVPDWGALVELMQAMRSQYRKAEEAARSRRHG